MPRLKLRQLLIRNFRSYGDYDTILQLDGLGPVLILAECSEEEPDKANRIGKSTLVDAIVWCLFGRLPSSIAPGDHIINDIIGRDCLVRLETTDGYIIERTRGYEGHDDLLITSPNGDYISRSTNKNTQLLLNELFDLDYDIFTSSVFFAQAGKSFLGLPDQKRKKALERMLNLSKFDKYALVTKEKIDNSEKKQQKFVGELDQIDRDIIRLTQHTEKNNDLKFNFELERQNKIEVVQNRLSSIDQKYINRENELRVEISAAEQQLSQIVLQNLDQLKKQWSTYIVNIELIQQVNNNFNKLRDEITRLISEQDILKIEESSNFEDRINDLDQKIMAAGLELKLLNHYDIGQITSDWTDFQQATHILEEYVNNKTSVQSIISQLEKEIIRLNLEIEQKICSSCGQNIPIGHEHIDNIVKTRDFLEKKLHEKELLEHEHDKLAKNIKKPTITIDNALSINNIYEKKIKYIEMLEYSKQTLNEQQRAILAGAVTRKHRIEQIELLIANKKKILQAKEAQLNKKQIEIEQTKPSTTIIEANLIKQQYDDKTREIKKLQDILIHLGDDKKLEIDQINEDITQIQNDVNPYQTIIADLQIELDNIRKQHGSITSRINQYNVLVRHLDYIQRAYTDRKRIKAFTVSEFIPFLNERITYYLDTFECDFSFKFNAMLQVESKRPYELWCGGEQKRIDLAIMFAIHDLHESIYEKQCNILVFDEYDRSLDRAGIYAFVNLLFKDFVNQDLTILVISHNEQMRDMFPTKIMVSKRDEFSHIEEVR
jgi:DNA repair exonuclease SbcCD ATPase subunit